VINSEFSLSTKNMEKERELNELSVRLGLEM
jgi:hypothetical protein